MVGQQDVLIKKLLHTSVLYWLTKVFVFVTVASQLSLTNEIIIIKGKVPGIKWFVSVCGILRIGQAKESPELYINFHKGYVKLETA